jgi:hypothetical protein
MMGCGMRSSMLSLSLPSSSARTQPLHAALVAAETWIAASGAHNTFAVVPNRSLIEIRGVDSVKYLQVRKTPPCNLSNDLPYIQSSIRRFRRYIHPSVLSYAL